MNPVRFVTGTDTGVGKTVVTAALTTLVAAPHVYKPAQTGIATGEPTDLDEVRRLVGPVPGSTGIQLRDPLAPDAAARREGVTLPSLCDQRDTVLELAERHSVLVEGAGGVLVNLGEHWNSLDLARMVAERVPVSFVVVVRAGLGTLNHAALTVGAIQQRGLHVEGVVVGSWPAEPGLAEEQNLADLPSYTGVPLLGRVPAGAGAWDRAAFVAAAPTWLTLPD